MPGSTCLDDFLQLYYSGCNYLKDEEDFYNLTKRYIEKCHSHNVVHCEIFVDPQTHLVRKNNSKDDELISIDTVLDGIRRGLDYGERKYNISSNIIVCFLKHLSCDDALTTFKLVEEYMKKHHPQDEIVEKDEEEDQKEEGKEEEGGDDQEEKEEEDDADEDETEDEDDNEDSDDDDEDSDDDDDDSDDDDGSNDSNYRYRNNNKSKKKKKKKKSKISKKASHKIITKLFKSKYDTNYPPKHRIIGIGLDSTELGNKPSKFQTLYEYVEKRHPDLKFTSHCGEEGPPSYIWDALNTLTIERIDHGVRCLEDKELVEYLRKEQIPLTVCPYSNVKLGVCKHLREHPIKQMIHENLCVCINSDDPAYFGSNYMNENYIDTCLQTKLSIPQIVTICQNGIYAAWGIPQTRKQELYNTIKDICSKYYTAPTSTSTSTKNETTAYGGNGKKTASTTLKRK